MERGGEQGARKENSSKGKEGKTFPHAKMGKGNQQPRRRREVFREKRSEGTSAPKRGGRRGIRNRVRTTKPSREAMNELIRGKGRERTKKSLAGNAV